MEYIWRDYDPETMGFVESWLDEAAVKATGLEDGFRDFYEYWAMEKPRISSFSSSSLSRFVPLP